MQLSNFKQLCTRAIVFLTWKEIVIESFAVTDMTAVTSAVLFRSEKVRAAVSTAINALKATSRSTTFDISMRPVMKDTDVYPSRTAHNSRDGNYFFEFCRCPHIEIVK